MPVNLVKRNGFWHIDDTLGPPGKRVHVRQSTKTTAAPGQASERYAAKE